MLFMWYTSLSIIIFSWSKVPYRNTLFTCCTVLAIFARSDLGRINQSCCLPKRT